MKVAVTEAQARHFSSTGEIFFEGVLSPDEKAVLTAQSEGTELWRKEKGLKKIVLSQTIGYIALELCKKRPLRLLFDCVTKESLELFSLPYQGIQIAFSVDLSTGSERFHLHKVTPENLTYIVVYGEDNSRYIASSPPYPFPKKLGYGYGDRLLNKDYPHLIK